MRDALTCGAAGVVAPAFDSDNGRVADTDLVGELSLGQVAIHPVTDKLPSQLSRIPPSFMLSAVAGAASCAALRGFLGCTTDRRRIHDVDLRWSGLLEGVNVETLKGEVRQRDRSEYIARSDGLSPSHAGQEGRQSIVL